MCTYFGIYRDNGIAVIPRKMVKAEMWAWLESFQTAINLFYENDFLQFTIRIWGVDRNDKTKSSKVSVDENNYFPFLDTEIYWYENYRVHLKPNQKLKYLNKSSNHTPGWSIYSGVFKRLAKLTSPTPENKMKSIAEIYPSHAKALSTADLLPKKIPTLLEQLKQNDDDKLAK